MGHFPHQHLFEPPLCQDKEHIYEFETRVNDDVIYQEPSVGDDSGCQGNGANRSDAVMATDETSNDAENTMNVCEAVKDTKYLEISSYTQVNKGKKEKEPKENGLGDEKDILEEGEFFLAENDVYEPTV